MYIIFLVLSHFVDCLKFLVVYFSTGDIMAQQLKFIACLKIVMEELSTLATGFEVDGGQLRYQLYVWLEKEVEVLKQLCKYSYDITTVEGGDLRQTGEEGF